MKGQIYIIEISHDLWYIMLVDNCIKITKSGLSFDGIILNTYLIKYQNL